jgi:hypothetical protein
MKSLCARIEDLLVEKGPEGLQEEQVLREHTAQCDQCFGLLEAYGQVEQELLTLETYDAPDQAVEELLVKVDTDQLADENSHLTEESFDSLKHPQIGLKKKVLITAAAVIKRSFAVLMLLFSKLFSLKLLKFAAGLAAAFLGGIVLSVILIALLDRVPEALLAYMEGSFGALAMIAAFFLMIGFGSARRFRAAGSFMVITIALFITRSMTSTFFNDSMIMGDEIGFSSRRALPLFSKRTRSPAAARDQLSTFSARTEALERQLKDTEERTSRVAKKLIEKMAKIERTAADRDYAGEPVVSLAEGSPDVSEGLPESGSVKEIRERSLRQEDPAAEFENYRWTGSENREKIGGKDIKRRNLKPGSLPSASSEFMSKLHVEEELDRIDGKLTGDYGHAVGEDKYQRSDLPQVPHEEFLNDESSLEDLERSEDTKNNVRHGRLTLRERNRPAKHDISSPADDSPFQDLADKFLDQRSSLKNLKFKEAAGYWANTYVPGDPVFRQLFSKLENHPQKKVSAAGPLVLEGHSEQPDQPFDLPENSALAVYLHADRRGIQNESRFLIQVGIQGTKRRGGRRPSMNIGLVLDLEGEVSVQDAKSMRALIDAFGRESDIGDRFSLTVAGKPGGVILEPDEFRHGPITVVMQTLFEDRKDLELIDRRTLTVTEAVMQAVDEVGSLDDPTAPLGSSAVILVTSGTLGESLPNLRDLAHQSAVAGIPISVIGVGSKVNLDNLEQIALSGQGNRRLLGAAAEAKALVEREVSAVSRVIARAVRLRIRLAPGVKLVDIPGSYRLDEVFAERVREGERSIDKRIARNLGIDADRGEDEEGIQIVIPTYYSGDSHVVLLDVVAPGPGPIADVRIRYKDLVHLRNGVASANLSLGRHEAEPGPLELNVLKNYLAYELSQVLRLVGSSVERQEYQEAIELVRYYIYLLHSIKKSMAGLSRDNDIDRDLVMLDEYLNYMTGRAPSDAETRDFLSDSLKLAGKLKLLPKPISSERRGGN